MIKWLQLIPIDYRDSTDQVHQLSALSAERVHQRDGQGVLTMAPAHPVTGYMRAIVSTTPLVEHVSGLIHRIVGSVRWDLLIIHYNLTRSVLACIAADNNVVGPESIEVLYVLAKWK